MLRSHIKTKAIQKVRTFCTKSEVKKDYKIEILSVLNIFAFTYIYYKFKNIEKKIYFMNIENEDRKDYLKSRIDESNDTNLILKKENDNQQYINILLSTATVLTAVSLLEKSWK